MNPPEKSITPSKTALTILKFGLPTVSAVLIACVFLISSMDTYDAARLYLRTCAMIEHVLMSLVLVVGGAILFDIAEREHQS